MLPDLCVNEPASLWNPETSNVGYPFDQRDSTNAGPAAPAPRGRSCTQSFRSSSIEPLNRTKTRNHLTRIGALVSCHCGNPPRFDDKASERKAIRNRLLAIGTRHSDGARDGRSEGTSDPFPRPASGVVNSGPGAQS